MEEARAAFRKSVELNGDFPEALAALGRSHLVEDDSRAADGIEALEAAVRRLPSQKDLVFDLVALYDRTGQREKSDALLKTALGSEAGPILARRKKSSEFQEALDRVNVLLGQRKEDAAIALLERIIATASDDVREVLEEQLRTARKGAARNRSIRQYNDAVTRLNRGDLKGALAAYKSVAATADDPVLVQAARDQVKRISRLLSRKGTKSPAQ